MSLDYGGLANKILADEKSVIYKYGAFCILSHIFTEY